MLLRLQASISGRPVTPIRCIRAICTEDGTRIESPRERFASTPTWFAAIPLEVLDAC